MRSKILLAAAAVMLAAQHPDLLLNPKAIVAPPPDTAEQLRANFKNPPSEYRSMPLWVWNDLLEWPRLQQMLGQYKAREFHAADVPVVRPQQPPVHRPLDGS